MLTSIKTGIAAAVVALGLAGTASAGEYGHGYGHGHGYGYGYGGGFTWKKVVHYQTVTHYIDKQDAYTDWVVKYDEYHRPYKFAVTKYRTIQVPVHKQVPVVKWVKVFHHDGYGSNGGF